MKKVFITQSNYIPWKGYFDAINTVDEFIIYDDLQYTRRDWRNRNKIKTNDGVKWLTIPVQVKGKYLQKINETMISDANWAVKHWKTITYNYAKAPYFKEYKDFFEELYRSQRYKYLSEINYTFLKMICEILGINTRFRRSNEFALVQGKTERLVNICKRAGASVYYSGPSAKEYLNESLFEDENIKVRYLDYFSYPAYHQLYGNFVHDVSIIDLIFNEGSNAGKFMKSLS